MKAKKKEMMMMISAIIARGRHLDCWMTNQRPDISRQGAIICADDTNVNNTQQMWPWSLLCKENTCPLNKLTQHFWLPWWWWWLLLLLLCLLLFLFIIASLGRCTNCRIKLITYLVHLVWIALGAKENACHSGVAIASGRVKSRVAILCVKLI